MKRIVAIGGGSIQDKTTLCIDQYLINLIESEEKKVLLIPIASGDNENYIHTFKHYYESLGAKVDVLLLSQTSNDNLIRSKIFASQLIYIGGGNVGKLMRVLKRSKVNEYLLQAYQRGIILSGISAGAMVYFESGYSDCNRCTNPEADFTKVKGIGLLPYCFTPHYNQPERASFDNFVKQHQLNGLAIEENCAVVFEENQMIHKIGDESTNAYSIIDEVKKTIK